MPSRTARPSSSKGRHKSHGDSFCSTKATPSLSLSSFSHFRALACPTADPERVVLLRGFYWKSSAADLCQVCEQDFGPVRQVLLYQGEFYPEAFVDFVHRRHAAQCTIHWAKPTKIHRAKDSCGDGSSFINWIFGVTAHSYKPPMNDGDWARAWKEKHRIDRGEQPQQVLAPRRKRAPVREGKGRRMQQQHCQARCPSASRSKGRQQPTLRDSGSTGIKELQSSPRMIDAGVMGDTSMDIDTVLTSATPNVSPSKDIMTAINVDDFLEKIVQASDMTILSFAKAALEHAAQNFMDIVDEFDALADQHCAPAKADNTGVRYSGCCCVGETSIEGAAGDQSAIGLVQSLFQIQQMIELDLGAQEWRIWLQ